MGRFLTRDAWMGDGNSPISYNRWIYANADPVFYADPSGRKVYHYDRDAAANYAMQWERYNNPAYGEFCRWSIGLHIGCDDCTNFVSQAIKAGGMPEDDMWFFSAAGISPARCDPTKYPWRASNCGTAWALTENLFKYLTTTRYFNYTQITGDMFNGQIPKSPNPIPESMLTAVQKGDVVFYKQDKNGTNFNHAAFVVGNGPLTHVVGNKQITEFKLPYHAPLVVDHSSDYSQYGPRSINDTTSPVYEMVIVHIPDLIYTPDIWDIFAVC